MIRFVAIAIVFIPGIIAAFGIKLMRDSIFNEFYPLFFYPSIQFIVGLLLFLGGIGFIGGFIVHRDRNKQKLKQQNKRRD
ncbi:putative lysophospholipase L1 biosynthesis ABC-type transport system permease subunit [Virgibacillus halotolerans]|uniref:DUF2627 family protein n=1 Tax=Virgibacillus halotolerans TaxID=1071053 RepID=UPI001962081B|nr:DUF2627 family protein [Virgibacillus halotolerans]MBM7598034.1 putative lysophospholipase L1 biosynthesis ABC-type transport system permease subunit [Virgibacillus halotolerans]